MTDQRDAAQIAHQLAGCLLAKEANTGRNYLLSRDATEVSKDRARMNKEVECFAVIPANDFVQEVEVQYPPDIMRGDLAEELIKRDRRGLAALQALPIQRVYSRSWFGFTGRNTSVDEMAACVADVNPGAITNLIDTQPFSGAEGAAFGNLMPTMGSCLRAGTKLDGKREPLRAALAEALFQRLANPGESTSTTNTTTSARTNNKRR